MRSEPRSARTPVCPLSRSLAATYEIDFSFSSSPYLDVSVQAVPSFKLCIYLNVTGVFPAGFPHSDIFGSRDICSSPKLFAAYHVFLRLPVPRHPPYALLSWPLWLSPANKDYSVSLWSCYLFRVCSLYNALLSQFITPRMSCHCFDFYFFYV